MAVIKSFRLDRSPQGNYVVLRTPGLRTEIHIPQRVFEQITNTLFPEVPAGLSRWDVGRHEDLPSNATPNDEWIEVK